jgi:hypothetical protein
VTYRRVLVDDHLLLRLLLGDEPADLRPTGAEVFTTGLWYHRLCRSIGDRGVTGVLSRSLGSADPSVAAAAIEAVATLPESVAMVSLRELAWPMARLVNEGARLNLMSLEALAAADYLDAELCLGVADENPPLVAAAGARQRHVRLVA